MKRLISLIAILSVTIGMNAANLPDFPFVVATGEAERDVKPDLATVTINILSFDKESAAALDQANAASEHIISLMEKYEIDINKLEAGNLNKSVSRNRINFKDVDILGYEVSRNLMLELDELSNYSDLMNEIVATQNVSRVETEFDASNRKNIEQELLEEASRDARDQAKVIVRSLDAKIHSLYAISKANNFNQFLGTFGAVSYSSLNFQMSRDNRRPTDMFIPDTISIGQSIHVVFRIKP
ncbi:MAG: SIMPL domain-containing protein [Gammaproteobacteria bacterium]